MARYWIKEEQKLTQAEKNQLPKGAESKIRISCDTKEDSWSIWIYYRVIQTKTYPNKTTFHAIVWIPDGRGFIRKSATGEMYDYLSWIEFSHTLAPPEDEPDPPAYGPMPRKKTRQEEIDEAFYALHGDKKTW